MLAFALTLICELSTGTIRYDCGTVALTVALALGGKDRQTLTNVREPANIVKSKVSAKSPMFSIVTATERDNLFVVFSNSVATFVMDIS